MNIRRNGIRTDTPDRKFKAVLSVEDGEVTISRRGRKKRFGRKPPEVVSAEEDWKGAGAEPGRGFTKRTAILAGAAVCAGVGLFSAAVLSRQPPAKDVTFEFLPPPVEELPTVAAPPIAPKEAVAWLRTLLASRDELEVESIIHPGAMSPGEAVAFLREFPGAKQIHWLGRIETFAEPVAALIVVPVRGPLAIVFFRQAAGGEWRIDFDAFARHSERPVGDFITGAASEGTYRLTAGADTYYNGPYADEKEWACYVLKSPDHPDVVYGYCRRTSAEWLAMARLESLVAARRQEDVALLLSGGGSNFRVTLALRREPGSDIRQAEITAVIADDWLVPATAD